jgi:hypothetical protein
VEDDMTDADKNYCNMHSLEVDRICRAQSDIQKLFDSIGSRVKMRTLMGILAVMSSVFVGMFGISTGISLRTMDSIEAHNKAITDKVESINSEVGDIRMGLNRCEVVMENLERKQSKDR